jgi:prolyl-tRNA synthetase
VAATLEEIQATLHDQAAHRRESRTADAASVDEAVDAAQTGFARIPWDVARDAETALNQAGVSVRCLQRPDGGLPDSSSEPGLTATVAKAY